MGFELERKTDILSLAAFLIAATGAGFQAQQWLRGPDVQFFPPDWVLVYSYHGAGEATETRIIASMSYANNAPQGYAMSIRKEWATYRTVTPDGKPRYSEQEWTGFGKILIQSDVLSLDEKQDAAPFAMDGGKAESHTTFFAPYPRPCYQPHCLDETPFIAEDEFANLLLSGQFSVDFKVETFSGAIFSATCKIEVNKDLVQLWATSQPRWFRAPCADEPRRDQSRFSRIGQALRRLWPSIT